MWISFGSVHEVRAFRERKRRSLWFRKLVERGIRTVRFDWKDRRLINRLLKER